MIKKTFTINEKNKDLGLLKKVRKQEKLRGDFWFWKLFWESWELFSTRHEHSISVPDSTSLNHCITDKTLQCLDQGSCFHTLSAENSLSKGKSIYYLLKFIIKRKIHLLFTTHAMATPITTPNSRHSINKTCFKGYLVEGDACILGVRTREVGV